MRFFGALFKPLRSSTSTISSSSTAWLSSLKAAQLQHIAFLTGMPSTGYKAELAERLSRGLKYPVDNDGESAGSRQKRDKDEMRILSIDMGIRNLAYAHFVIPSARTTSSSTSPVSRGRRKGKVNESDGPRTVVLDAWNRLAVSSLPATDPSGTEPMTFALDGLSHGQPEAATTPTTSPTNVSSKRKVKQSQSKRVSPKAEEVQGEEEDIESLSSSSSPSPSNKVGKESFSPDIYAARAYTLIISLVKTYNPTHILIERQRFRSGGGSAVLEWTIRVGVFEGMLYAVLQTLKAEHKRQLRMAQEEQGRKEASADGPAMNGRVEDIRVVGVEPQRVVRYWVDKTKQAETNHDDDKGEEDKRKPKGKITSQEGKNAKIDVMGAILSAGSGGGESPFPETARVSVDEGAQAGEVVRAFLDRWNQVNSRRKKVSPVLGSTRPEDGDSRSSSTKSRNTTTPKAKSRAQTNTSPSNGSGVEVGKLDDLADCLLQGLTWLEWRDMRMRIGRDGLAAVRFPEK